MLVAFDAAVEVVVVVAVAVSLGPVANVFVVALDINMFVKLSSLFIVYDTTENSEKA